MTDKTLELLENIGPESAGVIWLTEETLNPSMKHFQEFNYLLDGLLVHHLGENLNNNSCNLFLSHHFNRPFFIGQLKSDKDISKSVENLLSLALPLNNERVKIYILDEPKQNKNIIQKLNQKYPEFSFEYLQ